MPRINIPLAQPDLNVPRTPRGVVDVPEFAPVQEDAYAAGAIGRGLAGLGQGLQQGAELYLQGQAIEAQRTRAQDTLNAQEAGQRFRQDANKVWNTLRDTVPYDQLNEQFELAMKDLQATHKGNLRSARSQQLFTVEALTYTNTLTPHVQNYTYTQQESHRKTLLLTSIDEHTQGIVNAPDVATRQYHMDALQRLQQEFSTVRLLGPEETAGLTRKVRDDIATGETLRNIQLDPVAEKAVLRQRAANGQTHIGGVPIANFIDKAQAEIDEQTTRASVQEQHTAKQFTARQSQNSKILYTQITNAKSPAELDQYKQRVDRAALDPTGNGIDETDQRVLTAAIDAQRKAILAPREHSDPLVQQAWQQSIYPNLGTMTPGDIRSTLQRVLSDNRITDDDRQKHANALLGALDNAHFSKLPNYGEHEQTLRSAFQTTSQLLGFDEKSQQAEVLATAEFQREVDKVLQQQGRDKAVQLMPDIAATVLGRYRNSVFQRMQEKISTPLPLPPDIWRPAPNPASLTAEDSLARYTLAVQTIMQKNQAGEVGYNFLEATRMMELLEQQRKIEQHVIDQLPKATPPTPDRPWWQIGPLAPKTPTESGGSNSGSPKPASPLAPPSATPFSDRFKQMQKELSK